MSPSFSYLSAIFPKNIPKDTGVIPLIQAS